MKDQPDYKKVCLTIAGLDPSGGAGIIADARTFFAFGCQAAAAVTSITFQNAAAVTGVENQTPETIRRQLEPIFAETAISAVKIGMIPTADTIRAVTAILRENRVENLVVDPVVRSSSGFDLIDDDVLAALIEELLPLAALVTPNIPETELITKKSIATDDDITEAAEIIRSRGAKNILIKGGHFDIHGTSSRDFLFINGKRTILEAERIRSSSARGTGCMLSAAVAANLALGKDLIEAAATAKSYVTEIIRGSGQKRTVSHQE